MCSVSLASVRATLWTKDIVLPRIVDFGKLAVGKSKSKTIPLSCKVPIQFEYEITVLEATPPASSASPVELPEGCWEPLGGCRTVSNSQSSGGFVSRLLGTGHSPRTRPCSSNDED